MLAIHRRAGRPSKLHEPPSGATATPSVVKVTRSTSIEVPEGICLQCFNSQQRFTFPFLVYCPHSELLALVHSAQESATFPCKPGQLAGVIAKLSKGANNAVPPTRNRL
jgi:hypothetical protein